MRIPLVCEKALSSCVHQELQLPFTDMLFIRRTTATISNIIFFKRRAGRSGKAIKLQSLFFFYRSKRYKLHFPYSWSL